MVEKIIINFRTTPYFDVTISRISPIKLLVSIAIAVCAFLGWGIYWFSQQFPLGEKVPRLLQASREGNLDDINLFLLQGDDINVVDDNKRNALWWALVFDQYKAARLLLDRGIDVNSRSNNGLTVLEYCKTSRLTDQFEWLAKEIKNRGLENGIGKKVGFRGSVFYGKARYGGEVG